MNPQDCETCEIWEQLQTFADEDNRPFIPEEYCYLYGECRDYYYPEEVEKDV